MNNSLRKISVFLFLKKYATCFLSDKGVFRVRGLLIFYVKSPNLKKRQTYIIIYTLIITYQQCVNSFIPAHPLVNKIFFWAQGENCVSFFPCYFHYVFESSQEVRKTRQRRKVYTLNLRNSSYTAPTL